MAPQLSCPLLAVLPYMPLVPSRRRKPQKLTETKSKNPKSSKKTSPKGKGPKSPRGEILTKRSGAGLVKRTDAATAAAVAEEEKMRGKC